MNTEEKNTPMETAEELEAEKQQLVAEVDEDELRDKIAEELGLDPDEQSDILNKAVEREVEHRKTLSEAIGQKIKYREQLAEKTTKEPEAKPKEEPEKVDVKSEVLSVLEEQRLEDMNLPEELKQEVKKISKLNNISVKKAVEDPYIQYRKQELEAAAKAEEATISHTKKSSGIKFDPNVIPDIDVSTPEGQKEWDEYKKKLKEQEGK